MRTSTRFGAYGLIVAALFIVGGSLYGWEFFIPKALRPGPPKPRGWEFIAPRVKLVGHSNGVLCAAFFHDGKRAVTAGADRTIRIWDLQSGKELQKFEGHDDVISCVAVSPDDSLIASSGKDGSARVWEVKSGDLIAMVQIGTGSINTVIFSRDGKTIATGADTGSVRLWNIQSEQETYHLTTSNVITFAVSRDGRYIAVSGFDKTVAVYDLKTGTQLQTWPIPGNSQAVAFSPDGSKVYADVYPNTFMAWDVTSGENILKRTLGGGSEDIFAVSPDGNYLATASGSSNVNVYQLPTLTSVFHFSDSAPPTAWVHSIEFSPDGRRILTASGGGWSKMPNGGFERTLGNTARLWQLPDFINAQYAMNLPPPAKP